MIDKRLQYDRQMYALGQRVNFRRGGTGGGTGDAGSPGTNDDGSNANSGGDGGSTNREKGIMSQYSGPKGTTGNINDFSDDGGVDRSAVSQFSTYGKNKFNQNLQGPDIFSKIGTGIKDYIKGGGLIGMGIRGLTGLFGPPKASTGNVGPAGIKTDGTYGTVEDAIDAGRRNEPPREEGDGRGIMNLYNPYILPIEGEEEVPVSQEEENFKQRYRVANQFRQDKQGQLDSAILEMISKLYT